MAEIPKLDLHSKDIAADKQQKLKELFPEVFTEGDKIDFDKLRLTLGHGVDTNDERFGLHWAGKKECFSIIQEPSIGTLKPAKEESVNWDDTENLFIEGDNLEVLKLLQKSYYGKVKMIYIDPPYNTGKEFIYPDKYQENLDTYLAYTGQVDDKGYKFSTNAETEGRFHSNWLNMMYPRLFLAHNLLQEGGIAFFSIGQDELDNLLKIGHEIFGEHNYITTISRVMKTGGAKGNFFTPNIDFILVYLKNKEAASPFSAKMTKKQIETYYNKAQKDGKRKGELYGEERLYKASLDPRKNQRYWIKCPDNSYVIPPGINFPPKIEESEQIIPTSEDGIWKWIYTSYKKELEAGNIVFKKTKTSSLVNERREQAIWNIYNKKWLSEQQSKGVVPSNFFRAFENRQSAKELKELEIPFDFAKPSSLIRYLLEISNTSNNDIIMDFFSGSCSTAHATLDLNKDDSFNRKYIMVQLPEPTEEKTEGFKAGYKNIADIGKERIRRVIKKIGEEKTELKNELKTKEAALSELQAEKAKTPELFKNGKSKDLIKLEKSIEGLKAKITNIESTDLGFKVFKLDKSNFKIWDGSVENDVPKQIEMAINHINPDSTEFDILFEILIKAGFELTLPIQELNLAGKKVYSVEDNALLICLEKELTEEVIRAIATKEPARVVCLDSGFKNNDQLKTNAVQIMKSHNVHDFKTV